MKKKSKTSPKPSKSRVKSAIVPSSLDSCARAKELTPDDLKVHPVLRNYFGYCFYKAAMRYKAMMDEAIVARGINTSQMGMLRILKDMGAMSQNDLGSGMGIDKASMAKWIEQLDRRRLVDRTENPTDRRVKTVSITAKGEDLIEELVNIRKKVEDEFMTPLTPEERAMIRSVIPKLLR